PNPSILGRNVTLIATVPQTVLPVEVTFYDGVQILGTVPSSFGTAVFHTTLLGPGRRQLKAYFAGNSTYSAATSAILLHTVNANPGFGFTTTSFPTDPAAPVAAAIADVNNDGIPDLVVAEVGLTPPGGSQAPRSAVYLADAFGHFQFASSFF